MDMKVAFDQAVADSRNLPAKPDNESLLRLYSLYKQATEGDVGGDAPSRFDFIALAKYEAWTELKGKTREAAMQEYVDLVNRLKA